MGSFIDFTCSRKTVAFTPDKWQKRLGHKCDSCNNNLTHEKCLSLCKCYYFCHQSCFTSSFQPDLKDEDVDLICQKCQYILDIQLEANYKYSPAYSNGKCAKLGLSVFLILLSILMIVFTINSNLKPDLSFMLLYLQGLLLGLALYLTILTTRSILYLKTIRIKEIGSTRLEIQTSAFKDIQMQTNEQLTKDYLNFDSKKSRQ